MGVVVATALDARQSQSIATDPSRVLWVQMQTATSPSDYADLRKQAQSILRYRPMDIRAASLLGTIDGQQKNERKADAMMRAAFNLNRRDTVPNVWLFNQAIAHRRFDEAFAHADILLRRRLDLWPNFAPVLIAATQDPAAIKPMGKLLAAEPNWRDSFFAAANTANPALTQIMFSEIKSQGGKIQSPELGRFLSRLIEGKYYDEAYLNWLLFIPLDDLSKLHTVYDGEFEGWPQVYPFTWNFGQGVAGSIESTRDHGRPDEKALRIEYDGTSSPRFPRQLVMLTPGAYRLSGEYLTTNPEAAGRVAWTLTCNGQPQPFATVVAGDTRGQWRKFTAQVAVPDDCKAQWLAVTPKPGDRTAFVEVWYDRIAIETAEGAA